jgi:radical SAM superfamily enzyme YgiQ (UPF0313 family)
VRKFAELKLARGLKFSWFCYMQTASVLSYEPSTLELMRASGLYNVVLGAEAGSDETQSHVGKNIRGDENLMAAMLLSDLGVHSLLTYIIGYPEESLESMEATLEQARRITVEVPLARPEIWPYLPIVGTLEFERAIATGYHAPDSLEEWARVEDYWEADGMPGVIPQSILRARNLFMHYSSLAKGRPRQRIGIWERRARRKLETNRYRNAHTEARAFHVYNRLRA